MQAKDQRAEARNDGQPVGSLAVALNHAARLLKASPARAAEQVGEILRVVPRDPQALLILGIARRRLGDLAGAREIFTGLAAGRPGWAELHHQIGLTAAARGDSAGAMRSLRRALAIDGSLTEAWRALGDILTLRGDGAGADAAYAEHIKTSVSNPALMEAASSLCDGKLAVAERQLKSYLKEFPTDVAAIRMLAELATRLGRYGDAEALLERCLELAPSFDAARHNYAVVLHRQTKAAQALPELDRLLANEPRDPGYLNLKAAVLGQIGDYNKAIELYSIILTDYPEHARIWMNQGHALKTANRRQESIDAYRRALALMPSLGESYWSLANLKTFRFTDADVAEMAAQLAKPELSADDRLHFHFALGKAQEDAGLWEPAFANYAEGNRIRRAQVHYDADETTTAIQRVRGFFDPPLLAAKAGGGAPAPDPIFVVGLPRSGSTLIEQILSSHSMVEGTMELPELLSTVRVLGGRRKRADDSKYPEILAELPAERLRELGEAYLENTRIQRKTGRPFFIDKMPNNYPHVGLIHLILPNAKIVDARRHPLGACFSGFKQHFAHGQNFAYDLADLGRYYHDYVEVMAHFDAVLPGRVHRVFYERMVADTETEVRRLLDYCGLPFEEGCLKFYENDRAVRTASSEQVRRPIFSDGVDHWRHFEPWLDPLKAALGPVLDAYPAVPEFAPAEPWTRTTTNNENGGRDEGRGTS